MNSTPTPTPTPPPTLNKPLATLLTFTTALAALIIATGLALIIFTYHSNPSSTAPQLTPSTFHTFTPPTPTTSPSSLSLFPPSISNTSPLGLQLAAAGLLLLIATPLLRLLAAAALFILQRDYLFTTLSLLVAGALIYGLLLGK